MSKTKHDRLIKRVRKLYAMSQQTDQSPHEAEAALRNCMKLMERNGITYADLEDSDFGAAVLVNGDLTDLIYVQLLASAAASLHDCLAVFMAGESMEIRGHDIDVTVATLTFQYLWQTMGRLETNTIGIGKALEPTIKNKLEWRTGFAEGVGGKVAIIVAERKKQQQRNSSDGKALMIVKLDAVMANCAEDVTFTDRESSYQAPSTTATYMGESAGRQVSINSQVGSANPAPITTASNC